VQAGPGRQVASGELNIAPFVTGFVKYLFGNYYYYNEIVHVVQQNNKKD